MPAFTVILLVACLAGVASAAPQISDNCEHCKEGMKKMQENIPQTEQFLLSQCKKIDVKDLEVKCEARVKVFVDKLSKETAEQICQDLNICKSFTLGRPAQPMCALCEPCKKVAQMVKDGVPQVKDQLKGLCKNCGAPENVKKCEQAIDNFVNNVDQKSPEELCTEIGLCKKN